MGIDIPFSLFQGKAGGTMGLELLNRPILIMPREYIYPSKFAKIGTNRLKVLLNYPISDLPTLNIVVGAHPIGALPLDLIVAPPLLQPSVTKLLVLCGKIWILSQSWKISKKWVKMRDLPTCLLDR